MTTKHCIISFLVLIFVNVSISLQPGPIPFSARHADLIESQSCEQSGWSCKDCSTLQSCGPDDVFKYEISCGDQFPDRPYCDPSAGRCVSDRHVCAEMKDPEFKCPDVGIYPDLTDCRRYISCRAKGEFGLIYSCLFQSVYNPMAKKCITHSYCYDPMVDCNGEYKTVAYNLDRSLYIVCRGDQKPLIKDCGNKMLEYDPNLLACDFKCKEEGRFAHPTNNTLFYICVYNDNEIVRMMGLCREDTIYDEVYDTCVHVFDLNTTTQVMEVTTEPVTELETTKENISETTVDNNNETLETTIAANDEQNSEASTGNVEVITSETAFTEETTTDNKNGDETTINKQDFETTTQDALPNVTTENGQGISTEVVIEEITTTEILIVEEETSTSNVSVESDTVFTTNSIEGGVTTSSNTENVTNSSEEALETTEKNDTHEEIDITKEIDDTKESETNEETEETKEDNTKEDLEETDSNEETEEKEETEETKETEETEETQETEETEETEDTKEIQSNEDSNQSLQTTEDVDNSNNTDSQEPIMSKEKSNELKDKKRKCIGRICLPNWKTLRILKRKNSNK